MAKTDQNGISSTTYRYAGMSAEDAAQIKNIRIQQEKQHGSFTFSSDRHSSSTDNEETRLLKECPICGSPCSVPEFITPQLVDSLGFTSWLTSTPVSLAPPYEQRKTTSWRTSPSFACSPASGRPSSLQFPPPWQWSVPSFTPADDQPRFLLHFRGDN